MITLICHLCSKPYPVYLYQEKNSKFCSLKCLWKSKQQKSRSEDTKRKIREKLLGRRWRPVRKCLICEQDKVRAKRKYCSSKCFGMSIKGCISPNKGKKMSKESIEKIRKSKLGKRPWNYGKKCPEQSGEKCHLWKGGKQSEQEKIRTSEEYRMWRRTVFERDNFTCVWCKKRGSQLNADHIKSFADYPKLRLEVSNGRTLCVGCHKKTDTFPKNLRCATV